MRNKKTYFGVDVESGDVTILIEIAIAATVEILGTIVDGALSV